MATLLRSYPSSSAFRAICIIALLPLILLACGGGGGDKNGNGQNEPPNVLPVANAGGDAEVTELTEVTLDAGASSDSDGSISSYAWTQTEGPDVTLSASDSSSPSFTAPDVESVTTLSFTVTVTDNDGGQAQDTVAVTVNPAVSQPEFGLDARPSNTTCLAGDPPPNRANIKLTRVFTSLPRITDPVSLKQAPDDNSRWYLVEKAGRIRSFENTANADTFDNFLDIRDDVDASANESGLLAMAFHPEFDQNGHVFLFYQTRDNGPQESILTRYTSSDGGKTLDKNSKTVLLRFDPPYRNHYGGELAFDKDGYLFLTIGDGGSGNDPGNRAQNTKNIYGTILRLNINVNTAPYYDIPADNPFANNPLCNNNAQAGDGRTSDCPEIYAWGLRNGWRFSFDRETDTLWLGDVGQDRWEEIDIIEKGGNYGWKIREGANCRTGNSCQTVGLIDPVAEIRHPNGESVTGGVVYRGSKIASLIGRYIFADYRTGVFWALFDGEDGELDTVEIANSGMNVAHFAEDQDNEVYFLNYSAGRIYRIDPDNNDAAQAVPTLLSQTGCVNGEKPTEPASGLIPYSISAPFWSDDAVKSRYFALPNDKQISVNNEGQWVFPVGSVLVKDFKIDNKLIETRLMKRHSDGNWAGYTYAWRENQSDADLVNGGAIGAFNEPSWIYPREAQCLQCHTEAGGRALGLTTAQLNKSTLYPSTDRTAAQLNTLIHIGVVKDMPNSATLVDPFDANETLDKRARAYLQTNCSQCHRENGPANVNIDFRYELALSEMNICNEDPKSGDLNIANAKRLLPGKPEQSVIVQRMKLRDDANAMPPMGSFKIDDDGVKLIEDWVKSISSCN